MASKKKTPEVKFPTEVFVTLDEDYSEDGLSASRDDL